MADPTLSDASVAFMPFVGTGGATAIIVAWLGASKAAERGGQGSADRHPGIAADHLAMELVTNELKRLADAAEEIARHGDRLLDVMDIARVVGKLRRGD